MFRFLHGGRGQGGLSLTSARNFVPPTPRELCFMPCPCLDAIHPSSLCLLFAISECPMLALPLTSPNIDYQSVSCTR